MFVLTFFLTVAIWMVLIFLDLPDGLHLILGFSILYIPSSIYDISIKRRMIKFKANNKYYRVKYLVFALKIMICLITLIGFYQWYASVYDKIIWSILHTVVVAGLLAFNLYVDTFEGNWYRKLNINIIKDDFVQRKVITMLFLAIFVSVNAFIVFI